MLCQVAACAVLPYDAAIPLRSFTTAHNIEFRKATVIGIDFNTQQVTTDADPIPYDYLVVALGSTTNFFGNRLAEEHATPLKSLEDGIAVRNCVIDPLEEASRVTDPDKRRMLLTFVIVGGGATGVETAGAMGQVVKHVVPNNYPAINPEDCRVVLIESEPKLLGHMSGKMAEIALRDLRQAGVEVWLNAAAKSFSGEEVVIEDGRRVKAGTVLWTTGVRAPDVVRQLEVIHAHAGGIAVNEYLQLPTYPNVFAAGDNASIQNRVPVPLLAASAMQEGNCCRHKPGAAAPRQTVGFVPLPKSRQRDLVRARFWSRRNWRKGDRRLCRLAGVARRAYRTTHQSAQQSHDCFGLVESLVLRRRHCPV